MSVPGGPALQQICRGFLGGEGVGLHTNFVAVPCMSLHAVVVYVLPAVLSCPSTGNAALATGVYEL
jgi:hypothetical protein